jgi:hypothetical protein
LAGGDGGPTEAYVIDEHETILVDNRQAGGALRLRQFFPPRCDSALAEYQWTPWRASSRVARSPAIAHERPSGPARSNPRIGPLSPDRSQPLVEAARR